MAVTLKRKIDAFFVNFFISLMRGLFKGKTRKVCLGRGEFIGRILFYAGIRKKVVMKNLAIAFGEEFNNKQLNALAKKNYEFVGSNLGEVFYSQTITREELEELVVPENPEKFNELQKIAGEEAVILMGGHLGNWEFYNLMLPLFFSNVFTYSGKQRNVRVEKMMTDIRSRFGMELIPKSSRSTFAIMKRLKKKYTFGILADLGLSKNKIFINLFGLKYGVDIGTAYFHLRSNSKIYFTGIYRQPDYKYRIHVDEIKYESDSLEENTIFNITNAFTKKLETQIRKYPEQYFWMHRIWKHPPPEEPHRKVY